MIFREQRLKFWYWRKDMARRGRILFPSPAEVKFVRIMGGHAIELKRIRHYRTHYPLVIFISMGRRLRREFVEREKRVGAMMIDFAFETKYYKKGIEIDGSEFHMDIVKEQNRDDYLRARGWRILHIPARELYRDDKIIRQKVKKFLAK